MNYTRLDHGIKTIDVMHDEISETSLRTHHES